VKHNLMCISITSSTRLSRNGISAEKSLCEALAFRGTSVKVYLACTWCLS